MMDMPPLDFLSMAHEMLGMDEQSQALLRMAITLELLTAQSGIDDEQIRDAYEARIRAEITEVAETLKELSEG